MGSVIFDAYYTMASALSDFLNLENPYDHVFWNRDPYTARHRGGCNLTWDLPVGRGRRFLSSAPRVVNLILGRWQANWVAVFQSGQYFTPSFSGSDPSNTNTSGGLPDRIADGNYPPEKRKAYDYFDASAFKVPPAGRFGNSGVNILEAPGTNLHHISVVKQFSLTERLRLVYLANFVDIFNTPGTTLPAATFLCPRRLGGLLQPGVSGETTAGAGSTCVCGWSSENSEQSWHSGWINIQASSK